MNALAFPTIDGVSPECRPLLEGPRQHLGFVPNLLLGLSNVPPVLESYVALSKQFSRVGLSPVEMQTVLIVSSVENACSYCVAAHSTFATGAKIDPVVLVALRAGGPVPDPRLDALAGFVRALVRNGGRVPAPDRQRFLAAGYTPEQGLGVLVGVAMKTIANLGNHFMDTPLDPQFAPQQWVR